MEKTRKIKNLCKKEDFSDAILYNIKQEGDFLVLNAPSGFIAFPCIDSTEKGFSYSRCWLSGNFTERTSLRTYCFVSDNSDFEKERLKLLDYDNPLLEAKKLYKEPIADSKDFLIPAQGRYLWIMTEISNTDKEQPYISALHIQMNGDHMRDYLPAIYQNDDFTHRFLSIFDSMVSDLEQHIDSISKDFDIQRAEDEMLSYLASWLCIEPEQNTEKLRERLKTALSDYENMYTLKGIQQTILRLTGYEAIIIEGQNLNNSQMNQEMVEMYQKMYGDNTFRFFVLMSEAAFPTNQKREEFLEKMKFFIPAGVEMELVLLKNEMQLGTHTYLGMNTALQPASSAALTNEARIGFDTIIGGPLK